MLKEKTYFRIHYLFYTISFFLAGLKIFLDIKKSQFNVVSIFAIIISLMAFIGFIKLTKELKMELKKN